MTKFPATVFLATAMFLEGCASGPNSIAGLQVTSNPTKTELADTGSNGKLYLTVIDGLMKQGRNGAALAFLDGYSQSGQELAPRYWLMRGDALLGLGHNDEAATAFSNLAGTPLSAHGWNGLGRVAAAKREWEKASKNFDKAVNGDPANPDFLNNLAYADLNLHKADSATARLQQALELDPNSDRIRTNLIIALTMVGDGKRAGIVIASIKDSGHREAVQTLVKSAIASLTTEGKS